MKHIRIDVPEYELGPKLSVHSVAKKIDQTLVEHFNGQKVVLRAISSQKHTQHTKAELVEHVLTTGTDRYDPHNKGDRYENVEGKHIDFFGRVCTIGPGKYLSLFILKGFHVWVPNDYQHHKMDIWLVYDRTKLKSVMHMYEQHMILKRDGYVFKDPDNKANALLGIIEIV